MINENNVPIDEELIESMNAVFELIKRNPSNGDTDEQLKMRVVSHNLKALSQVMLIADDRPELFSLNLKQVVLGLLGTASWLDQDLPSQDPEIERNIKASFEG